MNKLQIYQFLRSQIKRCDEIIKEVDKSTGEHKCQFYINQLEYLDENQRHPLIAEQKSLHCMGMLRNNKGQVSCQGFNPPV